MNPASWLLAGICFLTAILLERGRTDDESVSGVRNDVHASADSESTGEQRSVSAEERGSGRVDRAKDVTPKRRTRRATAQSTDAVATGSRTTDDSSSQSDASATAPSQAHGIRRNKAGAWIWADGPSKGRYVPREDPAYPTEEHADGKTETAAASA